MIVDEVRTPKRGADRGFDAKEMVSEPVQAGIIDPAKVVRSALQHAASIAGMMLTTETLITDLKDKDKVAAGAQT